MRRGNVTIVARLEFLSTLGTLPHSLCDWIQTTLETSYRFQPAVFCVGMMDIVSINIVVKFYNPYTSHTRAMNNVIHIAAGGCSKSSSQLHTAEIGSSSYCSSCSRSCCKCCNSCCSRVEQYELRMDLLLLAAAAAAACSSSFTYRSKVMVAHKVVATQPPRCGSSCIYICLMCLTSFRLDRGWR